MHLSKANVNVFYAVLEKRFNMSRKEAVSIKTWMMRKLAERQMSTNKFVLLTGNRITNATLFRWYNGTFYPSEKKMRIICQTLSALPIKEGGKPDRYEQVSLLDAMGEIVGKFKEEGPTPEYPRRK